jgi:leader peptidase (prepilin peptidase)/N-methyltransferase
MTLIYILVFIFGSIVGSFLNVVIDRYGTGRGLGGRSKCDSTGRALSWHELIPIFSFFAQGGKSRHSKTRLSLQYPLVEASTGFVFVLIFMKFWPVVFRAPADFMFAMLFYFFVFSVLISIFVYDWKHKIIPDFFVWEFNILVFANVIFFYPTFLNILAGPLVALPLFLLWSVSKGRWIGFGDVKLALGLGWLLGLSAGFASLLLSFWIGAVFGIFLLLFKKPKNRQIPFAPFLILSAFLAFLYNIDMDFIFNLFYFFG